MKNPYLTPSRITTALRSIDLRPTRGMGQNFLTDPEALARIVEAAELDASDTVLEVGPGLGVLTWELIRRAGRVVAVELDKRLAARLRDEFADERRLTIVQTDILRIQPEQALGFADSDTPRPFYKVVANLPYAITSPVLRHLLEAAVKPVLLVVLVQWEVAARISARPGDLSVLAHSVQVYAEPEIIARVPAASFIPAPAVDSAILRLRVSPRPLVASGEIDGLMRVIKAGFLQARKKLSNALPSGLAAMGAPVPKEQAIAALEAAGVSPDQRAETVTLEQWVSVYRAIAAPRE